MFRGPHPWPLRAMPQLSPRPMALLSAPENECRDFPGSDVWVSDRLVGCPSRAQRPFQQRRSARDCNTASTCITAPFETISQTRPSKNRSGNTFLPPVSLSGCSYSSSSCLRREVEAVQLQMPDLFWGLLTKPGNTSTFINGEAGWDRGWG